MFYFSNILQISCCAEDMYWKSEFNYIHNCRRKTYGDSMKHSWGTELFFVKKNCKTLLSQHSKQVIKQMTLLYWSWLNATPVNIRPSWPLKPWLSLTSPLKWAEWDLLHLLCRSNEICSEWRQATRFLLLFSLLQVHLRLTERGAVGRRKISAPQGKRHHRQTQALKQAGDRDFG